MQAVILGAGAGTGRHGGATIPGVLVRVMGQTLLEHTLTALERLGITEFVLVTGQQAAAVEAYVRRKLLDRRYNLILVDDEAWQRGSAWSLRAARDVLRERFVVCAGDRLFDPQGLQGFLEMEGDLVGVFDSQPRFVDVERLVKANGSDGRVVQLDRELAEFEYVDVGLSLCSERIFPVLEGCIAAGKGDWDDVRRAWIEEGHELLIFDCRGTFWLTVETLEDVRRAEGLLRQRLTKPRDGVISRHLNRPLSTRLSSLLVRTSITPNQVTVISFALALLSALAFALGQPLTMALGGLLAQVASVVDGCDGEIARLKGLASRYGAWFDAVLDRWADALILLGMSWGEWSAHQRGEVWVLGFLALAASLILSYSESRYESAYREPLPVAGWQVPAKRDLRLFLVMLGGLFRQVPLVLGLIALLSTAEVARRLARQYKPAFRFRPTSAMGSEPTATEGSLRSQKRID